MRIGGKTRYRLFVLAFIAIALSVAGAITFAMRSWQIDNDLVQSREIGFAALAAGQYETAQREIGRYIQSRPDDVDALHACAQAIQHVPARGRAHLLEAARLCRHALDLEPGHIGIGHELLGLYRQLGFSTETIALASQLIHSDRSDTIALQAKALALAHMGQYAQALTIAAQYNDLVPLDLDFQLATLQMMHLAKEGNDDLLGYACSLVVASPDNPKSELVQAFAWMISGNPQAALEWAEKSVSREMPDLNCLARAVDLYDALGQFGEATGIVEYAACRDPEPRIFALLLERRWRLCQWQEVVDCAALIGPVDALDSRTAALYATALIESGQSQQAEAVLAALAQSYGDAEAEAWLAVIPVAFSAEPTDALVYLNTCIDAVARVPDSPYFCLLLARAYQRAGEPQLAMKYCGKASELAPNWSMPFVERSRILLRMGFADDALAAAREARARSPEDPQVLIALATAIARAGTAGDAQQMVTALCMLDQVSASHHEEIVPVRIALLASLGKTDDAVQAIAHALAMEPPLRRETLLSVASVSEEYGLGREETCYCWMRTAYGRTADLTYAEACTEQRCGHPGEGARLFINASGDDVVGRSLEWKLAQARYLDRIGDPGAKALWVELVEEHPGNIAVQWGALAAGSLSGDRAVRDQALVRLKDNIGPEGVAWRLARAKWLLEDAPSEAQVVEAAILASEATRIVSDQLPHLLLARCFERLGNSPLAAEQLSMASELARPVSMTGQIPVIASQPGGYRLRIMEQRQR